MASRKIRKKEIVVGTRGSRLALAQTQEVLTKLSRFFPDHEFKVRVVRTTGDKLLNTPLIRIGGKGLFVKELERALLRQEIDLAVHSLKDLPTESPKGLMIGAVTKREDPRDVLIFTSALRATFFRRRWRGGSVKRRRVRIGTSSLRRKAQLLVMWPEAEIVEVRGNLDTRIRKLRKGMVDGIVVAAAGVRRLKLKIKSEKLKMKELSFKQMLPAPGQGALAIECRKGDDEILRMLRRINHHPTQLATTAERALLSGLGGGCQVPIGAHAKVKGKRLRLRAGVFSLDGKAAYLVNVSGSKPEEVGNRAAKKLLQKGAKRLLEL